MVYAIVRAELNRIYETIVLAAPSHYYEMAAELRNAMHKNKLRLHELKYD